MITLVAKVGLVASDFIGRIWLVKKVNLFVSSLIITSIDCALNYYCNVDLNILIYFNLIHIITQYQLIKGQFGSIIADASFRKILCESTKTNPITFHCQDWKQINEQMRLLAETTILICPECEKANKKIISVLDLKQINEQMRLLAETTCPECEKANENKKSN